MQKRGNLNVQDMLGNFTRTEEAISPQDYSCLGGRCLAQPQGAPFMLQPLCICNYSDNFLAADSKVP